MTTPVGTHVRKGLEAMRDLVIDLFLVRVGLGVGLADTLCDDLAVTLFVTGQPTVSTLHTSGVFEKVATERAAHDVVECL